MFHFFRKEKPSGISHFTFQTDIHSHILPGIDDGSPDIDTSIELIRGLYDLGIRKTVATPHIIRDIYPNDANTIHAALEKTSAALKENGIDIEISAAAEYMLDDQFRKLVQNGAKLLTIHRNFILTEQSYAIPTPNLHEIVFELITEGYRPIMAHPERYFYYHDDYKKFERLKELGFMLQVNLLSLTGYYGKPVAKAAKYILANGLADLVGTDLHHHRHLAALRDPVNLALFEKHLGKREFNVLDNL